MTKETTDARREEIINVCEKLYKTNNFKDITIKSIGEETTFSRTSIYNYFQTKEEIFLALLTREYKRWADELETIYEKNSEMDKDTFADKLAKSIERRRNLLKLISMNMFDMEENSRMEELLRFKKYYALAIRTVRKCVDKFFKGMSEEEKDHFIFSFFPFMYGIYPYVELTDKQKEAMKEADVPHKNYTIYELALIGIKKLLK